MTEYEREGRGDERGAVSILRERLGVRYQASIDDGRAEIARVLAGELNISHGEADDMTRQLIDSGEIRYVTAAERDVDYSVPPTDETQSNVRHDQRREHDRGPAGLVEPDLVDRDARRHDELSQNAIAGQGGPQTTAAGLNAPAAGPVAAGSSGALPGTLPINVGPGSDPDNLDAGAGYWDFGSGAAGVRPSTTRKGQVEPLGT